MIRLGGVAVLMAVAMGASQSARADGALAVGAPANMARDGIAIGTSINRKTADEARAAALKQCRDYKSARKAASLCKEIGTFKGECYAVSLDPKAGMPGAGWAIAPTKALAEEQALDKCKATAGSERRDFCRIEDSKCDEM